MAEKENAKVKGKRTSRERTRDVVYIAMFTALIAVCSWITVPSVIPFTLQTFAIFLALNLLGGKRGSAAITCYILLGLFGVPVFTGFRGGFAVLSGPTGGYIVGFIVAGFIYWLVTHFFGEKTLVKCIAMILGFIAYSALGTVWFVFIAGAGNPVTFAYAFSVCVLPFIPFDCAKIALALVVGKVLSRALHLRTERAKTH